MPWILLLLLLTPTRDGGNVLQPSRKKRDNRWVPWVVGFVFFIGAVAVYGIAKQH